MKILFQGDSITDAGRSRDHDRNLGGGYPAQVQAELGFAEPGAHVFLNRGISGNRIVDVYARMRTDIINLAPDVMSILIGVNDVWHELGESPNGVPADKYYKMYCMLLEEVKEALPNLKIMIMEPFVLRCSATTEKWDYFRTEVAKRAEMAKKVAEKYGCVYIPLQEGFDALLEKAPADYWLGDGVHPTPAGHAFIKSRWLAALESIR